MVSETDEMENMQNSASETPSSAVLPSPSSTFVPQSFSHPLPEKLEEDNFLSWRHQALATIKGFCLQKYILGARSIPPRFLSSDDEESGTLNEEYIDWEVQDSLLLSWLLGSMSKAMTDELIGCEFSYQVWENLESHFPTQTRAKVTQLRTQLRTVKKGESSLTEFFLKIKKIVDNLASIGSLITVQEHIGAIFGGLDDDYEGSITSLLACAEPFSITELKPFLLTQEERFALKKQKSSVVLQANLVQKDKNSSFQNGPRSQNFGRGNGRGRGRGRFNNFNRLVCQLCGKNGHMAYKCYYRFDQAFSSPFAGSGTNNNAASSSNYGGNVTKNQVMLATTDAIYDPNWYPDSGSSCHLTPDAANVCSSSGYSGNNNVFMGDGTGLAIKNVGCSLIQSASKPLSIKSFLHVPGITKNLLSVSQFSRDNNVYFVFNANSCFVKCQETNHTLLEGHVRDGLYAFPSLKLQPPSNL